jgi:hypothetical protein
MVKKAGEIESRTARRSTSSECLTPKYRQLGACGMTYDVSELSTAMGLRSDRSSHRTSLCLEICSGNTVQSCELQRLRLSDKIMVLVLKIPSLLHMNSKPCCILLFMVPPLGP